MTGATTGSPAAFVAVALVLGAGARWMWLAQRVRLPRNAAPFLAANGVGTILGAIAVVLGTGTAGAVAATVAIVGGGIFLALFAGSRQITTPPAVTVGGPVLDFTATDDDDRPFSLASLRGTPYLLKFFRGHWCPFCLAELKRWAELRPELDALGVAFVTVCADTAAEIRTNRVKHGLRAIMVPDPDLAVTDRYRLRNPKNFAPRPGVIIPLPVPTTILVDANGVVRWIDQATDYMRRSDPERVLAVVRSVVGTIAAPDARRGRG